MAKKVIKGEKQNVGKRTRVLNLRKTKTLNNFNKNQNRIQYFVISREDRRDLPHSVGGGSGRWE